MFGVGVEGVKAAGGVPRRARGQDRALDQRHVAPAKFRQMVKNRGPDDASPDNDGAICDFMANLGENNRTSRLPKRVRTV